MTKPTIHDVAACAGVSKSTVSLVLQNSPLVKAATRRLVQQAMLDLGYVYNTAAAGLRGRNLAGGAAQETTKGITLACDLRDSNSAAFAAALQQEAAAKGLPLHLMAQNARQGGRCITTLPGSPSDEMTLTALHPAAQVRPLEGLAASRATRHLLGLGAAQVAMVGGNIAQDLDALRIRGYLQRLNSAGIAPLHLTGGSEFSFGRHAMAKLLQDYPACTAALCINDQVALGMAEALAERGIRVGEGFRLVGWGDTPQAQASGLSSVQPVWQALAQFCLQWALGGGPQSCEIEPNLIRRSSSMGGL